MKKPEAPRLAGLLLAAGSSRRLGQPKQFVKLNNESLVRRAAGLLLGLGADPVVVVTGFMSAEVSCDLQGLPLTVAMNEDWELGMGGSIACGMRNIPIEVDGVLLMLCDQWRLTSEDLLRIKSSWNSDISRIVVSGWKDGNSYFSGPPVIFPGKLIHEFKNVHGRTGAKPVIDRHREIVSMVQLKNAAYDLDEPQDLGQMD
jgi:molybdenum cofactor cytidylyltransferase